MRKPSFILLLTVLGLAGCGSQGLVCPKPQLYRRSGDVVDAAVDLKAVQARFAHSYSTPELNETIASLRQKIPDADDDAIFNFLVAAYCPVAVQRGNSISDQRARLLAFENAAHAVLGD